MSGRAKLLPYPESSFAKNETPGWSNTVSAVVADNQTLLPDKDLLKLNRLEFYEKK